MASGRELALDRKLDRTQVQLLQPPDLGRRERLLGHIRERCPAPEVERSLGSAVGDPLLRLAASLLDQPLKPRSIQGVLRHLELVSPAAGHDRRFRPVRVQGPSQTRDVELDVLRGARRRAFAPETVDQLAGADGSVGMQRQERQHRPLLAPPQGKSLAVDEGIDAAENSYLQSHFSAEPREPARIHATRSL